MAIQPISSINMVGSKSNISFVGKKRNENNHGESRIPEIKPSRLSVPLALVLAMSPLNMQSSANNRVFGDDYVSIESVESSYKTPAGITRTKASNGSGELVIVNDGKEKLSLEFKSNTKDGRVQQITVSKLTDVDTNDMFEALTGVSLSSSSDSKPKVLKELRPVVLDMIGDEGESGLQVTVDQLMVEGSGIGYSSGKLIDFLKDFMAGKVDGLKNDGAIVQGAPIERKVCVGSSGNLENGFRDTRWWEDGKKSSEAWGRTILSTDVETRQGKYTIFAVSTDNNKEDFESVIIKKEGGGEFKVAGLKFANINLEDNVKIGNFKMGIIELYKRNSNQKARILDQKLFETLWEVTNDTRFNNAYTTGMTSSNMLLFGKGVLSSRN